MGYIRCSFLPTSLSSLNIVTSTIALAAHFVGWEAWQKYKVPRVRLSVCLCLPLRASGASAAKAGLIDPHTHVRPYKCAKSGWTHRQTSTGPSRSTYIHTSA